VLTAETFRRDGDAGAHWEAPFGPRNQRARICQASCSRFVPRYDYTVAASCPARLGPPPAADPNGTACAKTPLAKQSAIVCQARRSMTEEAARRTAKLLARGMGVTFYVVRSRYGRFLAVQVPSDGCQILATVTPPKSANDRLAA